MEGLGVTLPALKAEGFLNPCIVDIGAMDRLKATSAFFNIPVQIGGRPVNCADDAVCIEDDATDHADVKDSDARLSFPLRSLDGNAVTGLHFLGTFWLRTFLPPKHPKPLINEALVLMFNTTPRRAYKPIVNHDCSLRFC